METTTILSHFSENIGVLSVYAIEYGLRVNKLNHQIRKLEADNFYIQHPGAINLYRTLRDRAQTDLELIEQKIKGLKMAKQREEEDQKNITTAVSYLEKEQADYDDQREADHYDMQRDDEITK